MGPGGQDDKIICVPCDDPNWSELNRLDDIPRQMRSEIEHFFSIYKQPEDKPVDIDGFFDDDVAREVIDEARQRWRESQ